MRGPSGFAGGPLRQRAAASDESLHGPELRSRTARPPSPPRTMDKTTREPTTPGSARARALPSCAAWLLRTSWLRLREHRSKRLVAPESSRLHRLDAFAERFGD